MPAAVSARWPRQEIPRIRFEPPALAGHENVAPVENLKIWEPPPTRFSAAISAFGATSISAIGHPQLAPGARSSRAYSKRPVESCTTRMSWTASRSLNARTARSDLTLQASRSQNAGVDGLVTPVTVAT